MAISVLKQTLEIEKLVGARQGQALLRAEALVPGAGREAIEVLLADANLTLGNVEVQKDRVVLEGVASCQAVYRQGEESALRALAAQATLSHVFEVAGAQPQMPCRALGEVEHVEAKYENGHMVFLVSVGIRVQVLSLEQQEVVTGLEGVENLETDSEQIRSVCLAAEASASALLTEEIDLPAALDARVALMDWATVVVDSVKPDLGGVKVAGKVNVEALIASGVTGRPVALIKYPMAFERLVEMPDWLAQNVFATASVSRLVTRVDQGEDGEDAALEIEAELEIRVQSAVENAVEALTDAYTTSGPSLVIQKEEIKPCVQIECQVLTDTFRGTLLLPENAPGVGTVLAVRVRPVIGGWGVEEETSTIDGVLEATVLYMPGGSDRVASARSEMPFSISYPGPLTGQSWVTVEAISAEASALMSDRLELKVSFLTKGETRVLQTYEILSSVEEGEDVKKRPGILLFWPGEKDDVWSIGKRYNIPISAVREMNGGSDNIQKGKAMMLKI